MITIKRGDYTRIARETGFSRQHVSKILRGKVGYSNKSITALSNALGVSIDGLIEHILKVSGKIKLRSREDKGCLAIWRDHFRLSGEPFSLTPDPSFLFLSQGHTEALAGLKLGLIERRGLTVMTGAVGTGKTTLVYTLLSTLDPKIECAYVANSSLSFDEILESTLRDFGVSSRGPRRLDLLDSLNGFLIRCAEAGRAAALVVDEAQNLSNETFEGLRLLLNFETYKSKLLQITLVGQPELGARLRDPNLRQIADRVALRCHLEPLSRAEAYSYISHRLEAVGGSSQLFTAAASNLLVKKSRRNPRRLNVLCHNAMLAAYGKGARRVSRPLVVEAVRQLQGSRSLLILPERWRRRIRATRKAANRTAKGGVVSK